MLMARRFTKSVWLLQMTFYVTQNSKRKPDDFSSKKKLTGHKGAKPAHILLIENARNRAKAVDAWRRPYKSI
jgi:hypothetical protein